MAGHSKFKNIMHRKNAQDRVRAKLFTKLGMEITSAAYKDPDPETNSTLRNAINQAKYHNLPKQNINSAIEKAKTATSISGSKIIELEAKGSGGTFIVIEIAESSKNHIIHDIRKVLNKGKWTMLGTGSTAFTFKKTGVFSYTAKHIANKGLSEEQLFEIAITNMADNVELENGEYFITCNIEDYSTLHTGLQESLGPSDIAETRFIPAETVCIEDVDVYRKYEYICNALEEMPEVLGIYSNVYSETEGSQDD